MVAKFPSYDDVRTLLLDTVGDLGDHDKLRMFVGCVLPPSEGSQTPRYCPYAVNLDVGVSDPKPKVDELTPFLLGSTTKTFTAAAYTLLFGNLIGTNAGGTKLDLNNVGLDQVFTDLNNLAFPNSGSGSPTFGQVVSFTSGLADIFWKTSIKEGYQIETFVSDLAAPIEPGDRPIFHSDAPGAYYYSDLGFALLGLLMSPGNTTIDPDYALDTLNGQIGTDLGSILTLTLFKPLGMSDKTQLYPLTNGPWNNGGVLPGYTLKEGASSFTSIHVGRELFPAYYAGGGVLTTGADFMLWLAFSMGLITGKSPVWAPPNTDLSSCLSAMYTPVTQMYPPPPADPTTPTTYTCSAWGAWCEGTPPQLTRTKFFKDGSLDGSSSYLTFWAGPDFNPGPGGVPAEAGVCVLLNCDATIPGKGELAKIIADGVLRIMLQVPP